MRCAAVRCGAVRCGTPTPSQYHGAACAAVRCGAVRDCRRVFDPRGAQRDDLELVRAAVDPVAVEDVRRRLQQQQSDASGGKGGGTTTWRGAGGVSSPRATRRGEARPHGVEREGYHHLERDVGGRHDPLGEGSGRGIITCTSPPLCVGAPKYAKSSSRSRSCPCTCARCDEGQRVMMRVMMVKVRRARHRGRGPAPRPRPLWGISDAGPLFPSAESEFPSLQTLCPRRQRWPDMPPPRRPL